MKIAVTSNGNSINSPTSPFFGRCNFFIISTVENNEILDSVAFENTASNQNSGAGINAAQIVGNQGVNSVISGAIGPKAFSVLKQLNIKMYTARPGTVSENIQKLIEGKLDEMNTSMGPVRPKGLGFGRGPGRGRHGRV